MAAKTDLKELVLVLGHEFAKPELLRVAITHPSSVIRTKARRAKKKDDVAVQAADNQRLEFLGDRVLGLVVAEMLFGAFPEEDEGALAKRLASLVRQEGLCRVAQVIGLGRYLVLSRGEEDSGGRDNPATLADACEAVIGALYLDAGLDPARAFIERYWKPMMSADAQPPQDAKTALQEWAQAAGLPLPAYEVVKSEGPPHDPVFQVAVRVAGHQPAMAAGRSKRAAEQAAATALLAALRP